MKQGNNKIAIIGLGYVGLPLAVEFARQYPTTGFDINQTRIDELKAGNDSTLEVAPDTRNSQIFRVIALIKRMNARADATDPWVDPDEAADLGLVTTSGPQKYDAIVIAVGHQDFSDTGIEKIRALGKAGCVIFDLKYLFDHQLTDVRL